MNEKSAEINLGQYELFQATYLTHHVRGHRIYMYEWNYDIFAEKCKKTLKKDIKIYPHKTFFWWKIEYNPMTMTMKIFDSTIIYKFI